MLVVAARAMPMVLRAAVVAPIGTKNVRYCFLSQMKKKDFEIIRDASQTIILKGGIYDTTMRLRAVDDVDSCVPGGTKSSSSPNLKFVAPQVASSGDLASFKVTKIRL